tara:strand:- start:6 stop:620 length:615 start_codon:yes stop_codon:yes gene_type:complete
MNKLWNFLNNRSSYPATDQYGLDFDDSAAFNYGLTGNRGGPASTNSGFGGSNMWGAIIGGGLSAWGAMNAANTAAKASLANAKAADWRNTQSILANRDTAKFGLGAQIYQNLFNERRANKDLARQQEAARYDLETLGPLRNRGQIDMFERMVDAESSPEATRLRKRKKREDFAGRMLTANANLSGIFGPTSQDQMYKAQLGMFS